MAPMKHPRAHFAAIYFMDSIYVFGGVSGRLGNSGITPMLNPIPCERYDVNKNIWEEMNI